MDERDEYESEAAEAAEPVTERVRIIGAEPVGEVSTPAEVAWGTAPAAERADVSRHYLGFVAEEGDADDPVADLGWAEPSGAIAGAPEPAVPDLPHWTEPATGQVPAILDRRGDDEDAWAADAGPAWREHRHEWEEAAFDPASLADEETRVGALDDAAPPEHLQWDLHELDQRHDDDVAEDVEAGEEPTPGRGRWSMPDLPGEPVADERGPFAPEPPAAPVWPVTAASGSALGAGRAEQDAASAGIDVDVPGATAAVAPRPAAPRRRGPAAGASRQRPAARRNGAGGRGAPPPGRRNVPLAVATGVGVAVVALACFAAGTVATVALAAVVVTLAAAECFAALRRTGAHPATLLGLFATAGLMVAAYAKGVAAFPLVIALTVVATMVWYLVGAQQGSPLRGITSTLFGFAWIGVLGAFGGLMLAPSQYPNRHGIAFLLGAVVAVVGADVGALAVGTWIGRHPLAPRVSPNKTWEGFFGGLVLAVVLSVAITGHVHPWTPAKAAILGLVAAVVGSIGDLCESLVKRDLGLKDMGSMLPGHGGVLDRVDALLFVLPATYYLVRVLHLG